MRNSAAFDLKPDPIGIKEYSLATDLLVLHSWDLLDHLLEIDSIGRGSLNRRTFGKLLEHSCDQPLDHGRQELLQIWGYGREVAKIFEDLFQLGSDLCHRC